MQAHKLGLKVTLMATCEAFPTLHLPITAQGSSSTTSESLLHATNAFAQLHAAAFRGAEAGPMRDSEQQEHPLSSTLIWG